MKKWMVYVYSDSTHRWEYYDTVFFDTGCDERYVRQSLIDHDGYPHTIRIVEA